MTDHQTLLRWEKQHTWHPFTPMKPWIAEEHEPLFIVRGEGAWLIDMQGQPYLDGNSSIWTCIHGHGHPYLVEKVCAQAQTLAHSSFLGLTHPGAAELAARLAGLTGLSRVFFSDDGSTAMEVALKMALEYHNHVGEPHRSRFVSFHHAYHGDTAAAASVGMIPKFHQYSPSLRFDVEKVDSLEELEKLPATHTQNLAAIVIEPLIQGVAGMQLWPVGMLKKLRAWCDAHRVLLIADEVMTGFGRTGKMFAYQHEEVLPDFLVLAKGLTGGMMPLAATLTTEKIFEAFLGEPSKAFYYGHSYTANPLGCAAALASLDVFENQKVLERVQVAIQVFHDALERLSRECRYVHEVRRLGLIAGIELARNRSTAERFDARANVGAQVCLAARKHGLLTRPIGDVLVLMPPLCSNPAEILQMVQALALAIREVCDPV